jgi:hypothetical protein
MTHVQPPEPFRQAQDFAVLSAELEAALLHELREQYRTLALTFFRGALRIPHIALVEARSRLGQWVEATRTVELSRAFVLREPWGVVVEVLKHEMAHQYVTEVLGERTESAHGPRFRAVCERLGIDPAAAGMPAVPATGPSEDERRVGDRIARLLALAESPNVHEAEAAMAAAQKLLLKHNLDLRSARRAQGYVWRHVGVPSGRTTEAERALSLLIARFFFVDVIWVPVYRVREGKRGSVLEICGTLENVEIAEYVHGYLLATSEHLWREHKKRLGIRGDRDRRTFLAGVMMGMRDKLTQQQQTSEEAGLVWVADGDLERFLRQRHPYIRRVQHAGNRRTEAYAHGREAGSTIVIHKGMREAATERGALLPPARR